ncbi:TPA: polyprenyl glycosylphosphotransferase, partial [Candidatus Peribacteria bacterium]|nr:polyprenyl glycosylphosphotransferase [Candidatus Peribacteria bacterium]
GSIIFIAVLSPILILIASAVYIETGWPIFYISKRVGEYGKKDIYVLKFRSMVKNADELKEKLVKKNERDDGPLFKIKDDPRITRVGKLLRRFDLDELPQLFNVLVGQMSLVGPRPHLPDEVKKYTSYQRRVFTVKPGMTGLAQVSGRSNLKFAEEVKLDLRYVEEWGVGMDLWIIWRTVFVMLAGEDN